MIDVRFTLSEVEFNEAQNYYLRATNRLIIWYAPALGLLILLSNGWSLWKHQLVLSSDLPKILGLGTFAILLLCTPLLIRRGFKKRYRMEALSLTDVQVQLDVFGYHSQKPDESRSDLAWTSFTSYGESDGLFLLFKNYSFFAIPKRLLDRASVDATRELIVSHLPKLTSKLARLQRR